MESKENEDKNPEETILFCSKTISTAVFFSYDWGQVGVKLVGLVRSIGRWFQISTEYGKQFAASINDRTSILCVEQVVCISSDYSANSKLKFQRAPIYHLDVSAGLYSLFSCIYRDSSASNIPLSHTSELPQPQRTTFLRR